ncbi:MAG: hypothetical protein ACREMZ_14295 [Gemmatimonadales bacterium]
MKRFIGMILFVVALVSCRAYDLESRLTDQGGLVPPDQFARYGREQAQAMAVAREFGQAGRGSAGEDREKRTEAAINYGRSLPDVVDIGADPQGLRLAIRFRSGWLTMVTPIDDGKAGAETVGLPANAGATR